METSVFYKPVLEGGLLSVSGCTSRLEMNPKRTIMMASVVLLGLLTALLWATSSRPKDAQGSRPLLVYCAAGLKVPMEVVAREYEAEFGIPVQIQFGGSGTLLNNLKVSQRGDLFVSADSSFVDIGRSNHLLAEVIPLARLSPVVVFARSNPKGIGSVKDLFQTGVRVSLAHPESTAIGSLVRRALVHSGQWASLSSKATVFKPTVNDVANDVKLGSVDAGIVWDATASQYPELESMSGPEWNGYSSEVSVCVLRSCDQPSAALRFARYMSARDRGLKAFAKDGFRVVEGDFWVPHPELLLYSGAVNRSAIEPTLQEFEQREGVSVTRVYNGCGILTAQIRSGQKPDAYFACDVSFMESVSREFRPAISLSETPLVLLVQKGNPGKIQALTDLSRAGLRVGLANEQQSALGTLTARLLRKLGNYDAVMQRVVVQAPTGDLLVNQMRSGALDVALVYAANASAVRESLDVVQLREAGALAIQPYAVGQNTRHAQLMERLLVALQSDRSRERFEQWGFRWKGGTP